MEISEDREQWFEEPLNAWSAAQIQRGAPSIPSINWADTEIEFENVQVLEAALNQLISAVLREVGAEGGVLSLRRIPRDPLSSIERRYGSLPADFKEAYSTHKQNLQSYLEKGWEGKYVAYIDGEAIGVDDRNIALYEQVEEEHGRPPDFITRITEPGSQEPLGL